MGNAIWAMIWKELGTAARKPQTYSWRSTTTLLLTLGIIGGFAFPLLPYWAVWGWEPIPVRLFVQGAWAGVIGLVACLGLPVLGLVVQLAATTVADERERISLDSLLTSDLTSFEIVVGKYLSCLMRMMTPVLASVPLFVLLRNVGGISDYGMLLTLLGIVTTAMFAGSFGVLASIYSRTPKIARSVTATFLVAWLDVPFLLELGGARWIPWVYPWIRPLNLLVLASSPCNMLQAVVPILRTGNPLWAALEMMALQLAATVVFLAWAVLRLRPISAYLAGGGPTTVRGGAGWRRRRPACGDDPMEWKERYTSTTGRATFVMGVIAYVMGFLGIGFIIALAARPAFREWAEAGYRWSGAFSARNEFNMMIMRPLSGFMGFILLILLAGLTSESFDLERTRSTWTVLLSTPLDGVEIVAPKRRASTRRCFSIYLGMGLLWILGVVIGALHPVGLALGIITVLAVTKLALARGAYSAIYAKDERASADRAIALLMVVMVLAPIPCIYTGRVELLPLAGASPPVAIALSLFSHEEVAAALGKTAFPGVPLLKIPSQANGMGWLLATALLAPLFHFAVGYKVSRSVDRDFDRVVGRPYREPMPEPKTTASQGLGWPHPALEAEGPGA